MGYNYLESEFISRVFYYYPCSRNFPFLSRTGKISSSNFPTLPVYRKYSKGTGRFDVLMT